MSKYYNTNVKEHQHTKNDSTSTLERIVHLYYYKKYKEASVYNPSIIVKLTTEVLLQMNSQYNLVYTQLL